MSDLLKKLQAAGAKVGSDVQEQPYRKSSSSATLLDKLKSAGANVDAGRELFPSHTATKETPTVNLVSGNKTKSDEQKVKQSLAQAQAASKKIADIKWLYDGKQNADGTIAFSSQKGVDAYNELVQEQNTHTNSANSLLEDMQKVADRAQASADSITKFFNEKSWRSQQDLNGIRAQINVLKQDMDYLRRNGYEVDDTLVGEYYSALDSAREVYGSYPNAEEYNKAAVTMQPEYDRSVKGYQSRIEDALAQGDWLSADEHLQQMAQENFTPEERDEAAKYFDHITSDKILHNYAENARNARDSRASEEARKAKEHILDLADRGNWEELYTLMHSPEGAKYKRLLKEGYGIDADSPQSREQNYMGLVSQLEYGDEYGFNTLARSGESYKTLLGTTTFTQRATDAIQRASEHEGSAAQMDSFTRAQTAYYVLDQLYYEMGFNTDTVAIPDNTRTRYLQKFLKEKCGVDLDGINASNGAEMIRKLQAEQGKKADLVGKTLKDQGFDADVVRQYMELSVQKGLNEESDKAFKEYWENANFWQKLGMNVLSIPHRAFISPLISATQLGTMGGKGSDTDNPNTYVPMVSQTDGATRIRTYTDEDIDSGFLSFLYNAGMSAADSAASALAFGKGATFFMSVAGAGDAANEILDRGGSREQALRGGIAAGVIEAMTEHFSIDQLLKGADSVNGFKSLMKSVGKQALTEASEEMTSEVLNIIVDSANMGNLSRNSQAVAKYMDKGLSYNEARYRVLIDNVKQVAEAGLSGAVSGGMSAMAFGTPSAVKGEINKKVNKTVAEIATVAKNATVPKTETELRAEQIQAENPKSTVIRSESTQAYIDTGKVTLKNAQKAASVLDAIVSGEKTELTTNEIDSLMLTTTAGSKVASKVLGIEVPRFAEKATARTQFRSIMAKYSEIRAESQNTAPVATEQFDGQIVQPDAETSVDPTYSTPDEVSDSTLREVYDSTFRADEQFTEPVVDTAPEAVSTDSDFVAENAGYVAPVTDSDADIDSSKQSASQPRMGYTAFTEKYRQYFNKDATDNELGTAYHRYSNPDEGGEYYGVRPSAEAFSLDAETVRAIDELGKLFGLDISFEDLGNDNGYYTTGTNKVVMDISPLRNDADNAFLFTASHELGHAIRDRIGMEAWSAFEKYAVAAMGGEKAVQAKQKQNAVYKNPTEAREDVACDFLGMLMSDKNTFDTFCKAVEKGQFNAEYAKGIGGLMQKIVDRVNSAKLSKAIRKRWGKDIANAKNAAQAILKAAEAAKKASRNDTTANSVKKATKDARISEGIASAVGTNGIVLETSNGDPAVVAKPSRNGIDAVIVDPVNWNTKYSKKTWEEDILTDEEGQDVSGKTLFRNLMKENGYSDTDIESAVRRMDSIIEVLTNDFAAFGKLQNNLEKGITTNILNPRQRVLFAMISNGDYPVNGELSTTCVNRQAFQNMFEKLVESGIMKDVVFNSAAIADMNAILRDHGYLTACFSCFVEARRVRVQKWAENFVSKWNEVAMKRGAKEQFGFFKYRENAEAMATGDIFDIEEQFSQVAKNDQGNVALPQGNVKKKINALLDKVPSLNKLLTVEDVMSVGGLNAMRRYGEGGQNVFALLRSSYGTASPKISQDFEAYGGDFAKMSFGYIKDTLGKSIPGAQDIVRKIATQKTEAAFEGKSYTKKAYSEEYSKNLNSAATKREAFREYLYSIAGIRYQSFSDFDITQVFDKMQVFNDIAANRAPLHEYTKVVADIRIFGMTGGKMNASVIHQVDPSLGKENAGLFRLANGQFGYVADDRRHYEESGKKNPHRAPQSIDYMDAVALMLDPRYSPNMGTIAIGFSDKHIRMMLDDNNIRMVIPYHRSGLPSLYMHLTGLSTVNADGKSELIVKDYTDTQTSSVKDLYNSQGKAVNPASLRKGDKKALREAAMSWKFAEHLNANNGDPIKTAREYLEWCASDHVFVTKDGKEYHFTVKPAFEQFSDHDNYYKVLIDFDPYDPVTGKIAKQGPVRISYAGDSEATTLNEQQLAEYRERLEATNMYTAEQIDGYIRWAQQDLMDILREELSKEQKYIESTDAQAGPAFEKVSGMLRTKYNRATYNENAVMAEHGIPAKKKSSETSYRQDTVLHESNFTKEGKIKKSVKELDADYMSAVESGDMETAQRMVDEAAKRAGYTIEAYHGSNADFTVFDKTRQGKGIDKYGAGFYFASHKDISERYGNKTYSTYLKLRNPIKIRSTTNGEDLYDVHVNKTQAYKILQRHPKMYDPEESPLGDFYDQYWEVGPKAWMVRDLASKYDSLGLLDGDPILFKNYPNELHEAVRDVMGYDGVQVWFDHNEFYTERYDYFYVAWFDNQMKSSEPVVRDDNGNVIPLSERFNEKKTDIRYSKKDTGVESYEADYGTEIRTQSQLDRAKERSNARADRERMYSKAEETAKEVDAKLTKLHEQEQANKRKQLERDMFTPPKKTAEKDLYGLSHAELRARVLDAEKRLSDAVRTNQLLFRQKEQAKAQMLPSNGVNLDPAGVYRYVKTLMKQNENTDLSNKAVKDITDRLMSVFTNTAAMVDQLGFDQAMEYLYCAGSEISETIIGNGRTYSGGDFNNTLYATHSNVRDYLRDTTIRLPKQFANDVSPDFAQWRNSYRGKLNVKLVDDGTGNVDSVYEELRTLAPWIANDNALSEADMLLQIAKAVDAIYASKNPDVPYSKAFSDEQISTLSLELSSSMFMEFDRVFNRPRLKTKMDKVIEAHKKHIANVKADARQQQAKAVSDAEAKARKDQQQKDTNAAVRIVSWYEKELGKVEAKYRAEIDRVKRRAAKNEHKAAMEAALIVTDKAAKQADRTAKAHAEELDKLDRKSQRKIQTLQRQMDREILRLKQRAKALAVRLTPEGAEVDAVMSEFRRHRDKIYADRDAISTDILSAEEIQKRKKKAKAKHDNALKRMYDGFVRAFVTDTLDIERFSKLQERPDTADVRLTMYRNRGATAETIQQSFLMSPGGDVLDERSLASVAVCWQHDKVGGKVDEPRQRLLQTYMYHRHGFDRMNVKNKAQARLDTFLDTHPEFDIASGRALAEGQKRLSRDDIMLLHKKGNALAVEYVELCKQFSAAKNKPVMGDEKGHPVSAETHRAIYEDLEKNDPWLKEKADTLYEWWDKFMLAWVVGSELSLEQYTAMKELYPHYVPTYRAFDKSDRGVFVTDKNGMTVKKSIHAAKGSTMDLMSVGDSLAVQVAKIVENHRFNELAMNIIDEVLVEENMSPEMFDYAVYDPYFRTNVDFRALDMDNVSEEIEGAHGRIEKDGKSVKLTAWSNGEAISVNVSAGMARSLESLMGKNDRFEKLVKAGSVLTNPMKTAITGINPFFAARNVPRDQALAEVNSIAGPLGFPIYLNKAVYHMATGSTQWQQFKALGGTGSGYYNAESGFTKSLKGENWASNGLKKMGAFNEASEAMTRFAEYLATIDKVGDTAEGRALGIKNAAEVTVDFSRHGEYGKLLNAWIPYWNPAVQGMSRLVRSVMSDRSVTGALKTLGKATAVSILPEALLMGLLYACGGYDEWEEFDDRSKDAYYLIPIGDGKAIKIAKSREWAQLIANPIMRAWQGLNGRDDPFDHYWETSIAPNFGISTPLDAVGISQAVDLLTNKDFAGRTIIPKEFENVRPEDQYNEATSFLAKVLGKAFKISPMKIDYVIGDYFGDFGDILIEVTNGQNANISDFAKDLFTSPFVADSAYSNHVNSEYYDMLDYFETELATMEIKEGESYKDSRLYGINQAINKYFKKPISELNKAVRETESEDGSRRLKMEIRSIQQEALDFYEACMAGEIEDPVRYLEYAPYGDAVRNELIRLKEYEGGDYAFTPSTNVPKIGDHVNTDEEKSAFVDIYNSHYTSEIGSVISSEQYQKSSDEEKLSLLEGARELAYYYAKKEWATKYGIKSDSYDPETESHKFDTLIKAGLSYFDAYAIKDKYNEIRDSAEYSSNTLRATAFAAWVDGQSNWSAEQKTMAKSSYKFTQTMVVGADKYDKLTGLGLSSDRSSAVVSIVSAVQPKDGETTVSDIRKWQAIVNSSDLSDSEKDKAIRAYMDSDNLSKYDACSRAGVTAREYVALRTTVNNLKPLKGNQSVTAGQKWDACIKTVSGDKKQDALLRSYMSDEQISKYNTCRSSGVTASMYVEYYNAKYSYGDGNGSWKQEELEKWLRSKPWSNKQKSALWKSTNSGWKYNPFE